MSLEDRRSATVRAVLDTAPPPVVPAELCAEAMRRGGRALGRRRVVRRTMWCVLVVAALAFVVWASMARPWVEPPSETTPPLTGW
ncbi:MULTISPECIES: hypothetical protein [unclassified Streptomyces]|uniref:hypothetical protein n=1 Tax=unclassified Streptomyces TaxID=2593676 RepID=UPI000DBA216F|nr:MULTISPECIES: hypothetical protein [unclassified Streptomyces]MYT68776.1 hypothetical protein [Streptomyces sp. SID8367]RAJ86449.1 hypothetical protein K377_03297 [Streptomyces sp. PsTaAH-137]